MPMSVTLKIRRRHRRACASPGRLAVRAARLPHAARRSRASPPASIDDLAHDYMVERAGHDPGDAQLRAARPHALSRRRSARRSITSCATASRATRSSRTGDIVNIDVTVIKDGYHGDTSRMFYVGKPSIQARRLVRGHLRGDVARHPRGAPGRAPGRHRRTRSSSFAEGHGFSVVREFCGHGIGRKFHEEPQVLHYGRPGTGLKLQPGMIFTDRADDQRRQARHPLRSPTAGPSSPPTTRCRRSGSTRCSSPTTASRC